MTILNGPDLDRSYTYICYALQQFQILQFQLTQGLAFRPRTIQIVFKHNRSVDGPWVDFMIPTTQTRDGVNSNGAYEVRPAQRSEI